MGIKRWIRRWVSQAVSEEVLRLQNRVVTLEYEVGKLKTWQEGMESALPKEIK